MDDKIYDLVFSIRDSGICNMLDLIAVQREAYEKGYDELVIFLEEHRKEYVQFILSGDR